MLDHARRRSALDWTASARPCGLQSFAPLRARAFCPAPLPWLRDGATLSERAHLCRSCPMQCPLLSFSWVGWKARETCSRTKEVVIWAHLHLSLFTPLSPPLQPSRHTLTP